MRPGYGVLPNENTSHINSSFTGPLNFIRISRELVEDMTNNFSYFFWKFVKEVSYLRRPCRWPVRWWDPGTACCQTRTPPTSIFQNSTRHTPSCMYLDTHTQRSTEVSRSQRSWTGQSRSVECRPHTTQLYPALSSVASSIFLQLYLKVR